MADKIEEGGEEEGINPNKREWPLRPSPVPYPFLRVHTYPSRRAYVRYMATSRVAILLPRDMRVEAAADPGLEWDPATFSYRRASRRAQ